ncbi:MerR family transcriptional regulator [Draconibacterium sediminis]|uniref:Helix-turn-helix domain-containing protein n=1 Tax=Draconibacterium sediminis TaxID=1544798 RepID=A0A0D8JEN2_9BACT|nr:hypothetical protein [Draconibacterium sediminis]KJF45360.1 hypothetical protein LH29_08295 [Draconibacterium sediminis]
MNKSNFKLKDYKNVRLVFSPGELYEFHKETEGMPDRAFMDSMVQKAIEVKNSNTDLQTVIRESGVIRSTDVANLPPISKDESSDSSEEEDKLITRKEAMRLLNVKTVLTMIRWEEKGILNPLRINSRIRYWKSEILDAAESFQRLR